jgi:hypothetical protein
LSCPLMYVFLILSLLVFPTVPLRNFISAACSLLSSLFVSAPYNSSFLKYLLNTVIVYFCLYLYSIINS